MLLTLHLLMLLETGAATYVYGGKITASAAFGGRLETALSAGVFGGSITAGVTGGNIGVTK